MNFFFQTSIEGAMLACACALAVVPRAVPLPVAVSRALIRQHSLAETRPERKNALVWSHHLYEDLPPDVATVAVARDDEVRAVALLERRAEGAAVVLRDVAAFDDASGTVLVHALHKSLGDALHPGRTLQPRWRAAYRYVRA